ncbi:hypothetical protein BKA70DRAFT_1254795 [Coprinopsis sp. MPI-PUGE-AT-0042]|nr:hypothetical protein BKA70DRAFT_1254795 [Coprinopsis sp. MPI-PUGE-AT-0042]
MSQLPTELIEEIVNHIPSFRREDVLRQASLVCRAFRGPCQRALFTRLLLTYNNDLAKEKPGSKLLQIFRETPILATYVQQVTLIDARYDWPMLADDVGLSEVLVLLADSGNVTVFQCALSKEARGGMPSGILEAITALSGTPGLIEGEFSYVPLRTIRLRANNLAKLNLRSREDEEWITQHTQGLAPVLPRPQVTALELHLHEALIEFIMDPTHGIDLTALEELHFRGARIPGNIMRPLLACEKTLGSLRIGDYRILSLLGSSLVNLVTLSVGVLRLDASASTEIQGFLNRVSGSNILKTFTIITATPLKGRVVSRLSDPTGSSSRSEEAYWGEIDVILANTERFPCFHEFVCRSAVVATSADQRKRHEKLLPQLMKTGRAVVE